MDQQRLQELGDLCHLCYYSPKKNEMDHHPFNDMFPPKGMANYSLCHVPSPKIG